MPLPSFLVKPFQNLLHLWLVPGNSTILHLFVFMLLACQEATLTPFCPSAPHKNIGAYHNLQQQKPSLTHMQRTHPFLSVGPGFQDCPGDVGDLPIVPSAFRCQVEQGQMLTSPARSPISMTIRMLIFSQGLNSPDLAWRMRSQPREVWLQASKKTDVCYRHRSLILYSHLLFIQYRLQVN